MNIWTRGISPRCGYRNAWTLIKTFTFAAVWGNFGNFSVRPKRFSVAMNDNGRSLVISLWLEKSNNRNSGGIAAHSDQNIPSAIFRWKISASIFFLIKSESSSLIILHKAKLLTLSVTHNWCCIWRSFLRKNSSGSSPRVFWSYTSMPRHAGTCKPKKLAYVGFHYLDHPPYSYSSELVPWEYNLFPGLKKQLIVRHFSSDA